MALGDKTVNYNFYGATYRDLALRRSINPDVYESELLCKIVEKDTGHGYYLDLEQLPFTNKFNYGKELDDSVALWSIPASASFNHATFCVKNSATLNYQCVTNDNVGNVPLAMQYADISSFYKGFSTNPVNRLAYDYSSAGGYYNSALIADIRYTAVCDTAGINIYNRSSDSTSGAPSLSTVAAWIDADSANRDITGLRVTLFAGTEYPRIDQSVKTNTTGIPEIDGRTIAPINVGVPFIDTLSPLPIPDNAPVIRSRIKDSHDDWTDDKIYAPFGFQYGRAWYDTETQDVDNLHRIGMYRSYTVNNVINGQGSPANERGIFCRCNFTEKVFSDVCYKWEMCCYYPTQNKFLDNGFDLTTLSGSDNLRFYTRLVITDAKGVSKGTATYRAILHELAYIGLYFTKTGALARDTNFLTDSLTDVFCPVFANGCTTGEYKTGNEIKTLPNWNSNSVGDEVFQNIPGASDSDSGDLNTHLHSGKLSGSSRYYGTSALYMSIVTQWLNTVYKPDETQLTEDFKGVNPSDYIVSLRYYPFDVPIDNRQSEELSIGGIPVTVNNFTPMMPVLPIEYGEGSNSYYDLGSFTLQPPFIYGDFRDTYIKLLLYIPWCGYTTLDPALFCQSPDGTYHTIRAALSIDFTTGNVLGLIYRDNRLIDTVNGTVGVDIPLSAAANGSYQNAIKQTEIALKNARAQQLTAYLSAAGSVVGGVASIAAGNVTGAVASAAALVGTATKVQQVNNNIEGLQYQLTHTAPSVGDVSSASPFNSALSEQAARIFIFKPVMLTDADVSTYGKTTGFACCRAGKLSTFSGFTVCADVDLSGFNAPAHHKLLIKQALQKGVYL